MDLRDRLNRYYYDNTVYDLCQLNRSGGGNLNEKWEKIAA